jgi:hypothetical protein
MLRLVSSSDDPAGVDYRNVAESLRLYAAEIEAGRYGEVICALLVIETPDEIKTLGCGEDPTPYEVMGIFEAAKLQAFADQANGLFDD